MKKYYTMYDQSSQTVGGKNYIQVGIGERNKYVDIGQIRYEPHFKDYLRAPEGLDQSKIMAGYTDQYTEDTTVDPKIKPTFPGDPDWDDNDDSGKVIPDNVPADTGLKWAFIGIGIAGVVLLVVTLVCCMRTK